MSPSGLPESEVFIIIIYLKFGFFFNTFIAINYKVV
jgi:hypothetical protein